MAADLGVGLSLVGKSRPDDKRQPCNDPDKSGLYLFQS
jgi:hypothetical protein